MIRLTLQGRFFFWTSLASQGFDAEESGNSQGQSWMRLRLRSAGARRVRVRRSLRAGLYLVQLGHLSLILIGVALMTVPMLSLICMTPLTRLRVLVRTICLPRLVSRTGTSTVCPPGIFATAAANLICLGARTGVLSLDRTSLTRTKRSIWLVHITPSAAGRLQVTDTGHAARLHRIGVLAGDTGRGITGGSATSSPPNVVIISALLAFGSTSHESTEVISLGPKTVPSCGCVNNGRSSLMTPWTRTDWPAPVIRLRIKGNSPPAHPANTLFCSPNCGPKAPE
jgi:hypothetical protein